MLNFYRDGHCYLISSCCAGFIDFSLSRSLNASPRVFPLVGKDGLAPSKPFRAASLQPAGIATIRLPHMCACCCSCLYHHMCGCRPNFYPWNVHRCRYRPQQPLSISLRCCATLSSSGSDPDACAGKDLHLALSFVGFEPTWKFSPYLSTVYSPCVYIFRHRTNRLLTSVVEPANHHRTATPSTNTGNHSSLMLQADVCGIGIKSPGILHLQPT